MQKILLFIIILLVCPVLVFAFDTSAFIPFKMNSFLEAKSDDKNVRCEDLIVKEENIFNLKTITSTINLKNLSKKKRQISFHIVLYDKNYKFLAVGLYGSVPGFGGFEPRESSNSDIQFGCFADFSKVKYYQYKIYSVFSE